MELLLINFTNLNLLQGQRGIQNSFAADRSYDGHCVFGTTFHNHEPIFEHVIQVNLTKLT